MTQVPAMAPIGPNVEMLLKEDVNDLVLKWMLLKSHFAKLRFCLKVRFGRSDVIDTQADSNMKRHDVGRSFPSRRSHCIQEPPRT